MCQKNEHVLLQNKHFASTKRSFSHLCFKNVGSGFNGFCSRGVGGVAIKLTFRKNQKIDFAGSPGGL